MNTKDDMDALILAAGRGERLGMGPKAFVNLGGKTLLDMVLTKARAMAHRVLVGYPPGGEEAVRPYADAGVILLAGGATRQETIRILMERSNADLLLVLDAARPLASSRLMRSVADQARRHGAAVACLRPVVPALLPEGDWLRSTLGRSQYLLPQSPQAYRRETLQRIYGFLDAGGQVFQTTHEAAVRAGVPVRLVEGEALNIKITTPADLVHAQALLSLLESSE